LSTAAADVDADVVAEADCRHFEEFFALNGDGRLCSIQSVIGMLKVVTLLPLTIQ